MKKQTHIFHVEINVLLVDVLVLLYYREHLLRQLLGIKLSDLLRELLLLLGRERNLRRGRAKKVRSEWSGLVW